ncbi:hypothetical protein BDQ17DRAFT_1433679 [Cyathus striatus]|nr:hypothetical protein BDQ17DRAFT_1433679 [Cyathus striatus]
MLSESQQRAIEAVKSRLYEDGLDPSILDGITFRPIPTFPQPDTVAIQSIDAIVEYLESNPATRMPTGYRFAINPGLNDFYHPKTNLQYSLGGKRGGEPNVYCGTLLNDPEGKPVLCNKSKSSCRGIKTCEFHSACNQNDFRFSVSSDISPERNIFEKTLAFFCAVKEAGCSFDQRSDVELDYGGSDSAISECSFDCDQDAPLVKITLNKSRKRRTASLCKGNMVIVYNKYNQPRLQCQYRTNSNHDHLLLRNIQEFDISYLEALLSNDKVRIKHYEQRAYEKGYGPLVPCMFQASPSEQKQCCPHLHRADSGELRQGILRTMSKCLVQFSIYTPNDLDTCPFIVIISRNLHNHARPLAVKTPPAIKDVFCSMLVDLDWKLADTTPRKLAVDAGFTKSLRQYLNWELMVDPRFLNCTHP